LFDIVREAGRGPDPGGAILPKTYESNFFHHNCIQFGKQHLPYKAILSSSFWHSRVVKYISIILQSKPAMRLDYEIILKSPP